MKYPFTRQRPEVYAPESMKNYFTLALAGLLAGCAAPHHEQVIVHHEPAVHQEKELAPAVFRKPLLSPGAQFGALPPPVQNTVIAEAGSEVIWDVVKDNSSGQTVYIIYSPLSVGRDGSVLNPDLTVAVHAPEYKAAALGINVGTQTVKLTDLPPKVLEVIHEQASHSEVATIDKATWGNRTVYIVTFKDESHHSKLYVEADGTLLKDIR
jgi:hypothetical protein